MPSGDVPTAQAICAAHRLSALFLREHWLCTLIFSHRQSLVSSHPDNQEFPLCLYLCNAIKGRWYQHGKVLGYSKWKQAQMQQPQIEKWRKRAAYLWKASARKGSPAEIPSPPLPNLKWGLGRGGSWLHPFRPLRYTACTWAPLSWPCLPTRCSITASGRALALPLQKTSNLI